VPAHYAAEHLCAAAPGAGCDLLLVTANSPGMSVPSPALGAGAIALSWPTLTLRHYYFARNETSGFIHETRCNLRLSADGVGARRLRDIRQGLPRPFPQVN
jgi:hypothetical protein